MSLNILVADDELLIRKAIIARLTRGFENITNIYEAEDGREAIDILQNESIDIVLSDIRMPVIDGIGVIEYIYKNNKTIKAKSIIISGFAEFEYAEKAIKYGVSAYILKPIQSDEFINVMNKVIKETQSEKKVEKKNTISNKDELIINQLFLYGQVESNPLELFSNYQEGYTFSTMLINVDGISYLNSQFGYEDKALLKFSVMNVVKDLFTEDIGVCVNSSMDGNQMIIVLCQTDKNTLEEVIQKLCVSIIYNIKKILNSSVTIGVSNNYDTLHKQMYDEALIALDSRYSYGKGKTYFFTQKSIGDYYGFARQKLSMLEKCIDKRDNESVGEVIRDIFRRFKNEDIDKSYIRLLIKDILMIVYKANYECLKVNTLVNQNHIIWQLTKDCEEIDEIATSVMRYCEGIISQTAQKSNHEITIEILQYVKENFNDDISLEMLAEHFLLSSNYVYTILKKETGKSYKQHLKEIRLHEAKRLLQDTELTIGDIGELCGYKDSLYFSRLFKKAVGKSPSQYRMQKTLNDRGETYE